MGFLLGAFGKLSAGRRVRNLQARMMKVQARARRVSRDVEKMTKMLDNQEKRALNDLTMMSNAQYNMAQQTFIANTGLGDIMNKIGMGGMQGLTADEKQQYSDNMTAMSQNLSQMKSQNDMYVAQMKQQIQDQFEMMRDQMLEPLKDEEELLMTEKDSLETQYNIAKEDYEACKKMEQADAKNMAPNYTGQ